MSLPINQCIEAFYTIPMKYGYFDKRYQVARESDFETQAQEKIQADPTEASEIAES